MTELMEELYSLVVTSLMLNSPRLSGNMKNHIKTKEISNHRVIIEIEAPFYDAKMWQKYKTIVYTGPPKKYPGVTDYAYWVNVVGAFGKHNKSEHWINRTLDDTCRAVAGEYNAEVINKIGR